MRNKIRLTLLAAIVLLGGASVPELGQTAIPQSNKPKGTLHQQAKEAGGKVVLRYRLNRSTIYPNIEELAKRTDVIVVGRTLSHKANLSRNERFITQDFLVKVQEVIKGDIPNGKSILISMPGGAFEFPDGTYAAVIPEGYKQAEDGQTYVFFLRSEMKDSVFKGHRLVSQSQGMFTLTKGKDAKNGTVEPADLVTADPVVMKYRGRSATDFLGQIHMAVPQQRK